MDYQKLFSVIPKEPRRWTQCDVESWLEFIGLQDLSDVFQRNAIDGACLEVLNDDDLNELGISSNVKKKKILQWIQNGFIEYKQFVRNNVGQSEWSIASKQIVNKENLDYTPIQRLNDFKPRRDSFQDNHKVELVESMKVVEAPQILKQPKQNLEATKIPSYPNQIKQTESMHTMELVCIGDNQKVSVSEKGLSIGRNPENTLVLGEDYVSRNHCQIEFDQKTKNFYLKDTGSTSGTFVLLMQPSLMRLGLILHMGSMQYKIEQMNGSNQQCDVVLRVIEGVQKNQKFSFQLVKNQNCLKFGRQLDQFRMDTHLSGVHAQFSYTNDGLILEDMGSRNGVWVRLSEQGQCSERVKLTQDRQFRLGYEKIYLSNSAISIKLVIVGDGSVGKTCILIRYTEDKFPTDYVPTIFENYCAQVLYENKMVNLNLWDTAGQEEYKQLRSISYPQSDVFLITFSVDEPSSFQNAIKKWYPELQADQPNAPKIFIGNKIDMRPTENVNENKFVTFNIAQKVVSDLGCKYIECSALNGTNIKQIFLEAIKQAMKKKFPQQTSQTSGPAKTQTGTQRKSNSNDNADASGKCSIQ
ncbi:unnamed protein product (macronuclear) [Paramecium tetraurelia]|uniref:Uncharacterized protein n=1 Tax=Paramecium tetraurelia TaxID=5888 RepID=A0D4Q1_PARTE|nr:uncharacterized protein GSPATT00013465001 [Paramecium tetraurelia]CAK78018.1 unnamed protein product [Paramecium tetraurelia]|eukprot:XP_001445415.1 hypothetical protein (macronuclear) [Paramecium tetraurelia strain d4-2]